MPLISKQRSKNWNRTIGLLHLTINSLLAQNDPNWQVIIVCQEKPDLPDDPRVHFRRFEKDVSSNLRTDKWMKLALAYRVWIRELPKDGYLFPLDADDLLHPDLVRRILNKRHQGAVILKRGFMLNVKSGEMSRLFGQGRNTGIAFFGTCGSSAAIRVSPDHFYKPTYVAQSYIDHGKPQIHFPLFGYDILYMNFPAGIYCLNHGDNMDWDVRSHGQIATIRKNALNPGHRDKVLQRFGLTLEAFMRLTHTPSE
ncbi:MAG: glycosyltransferase family A protein [Pseudomonadota bacterium]